MDEQPKRKVGRPSTYDPDTCRLMIEYFDRPPFQSVLSERLYAPDGTIEKEIYRETPCDLPLFSGFAADNGWYSELLFLWRDAHPEMMATYKRCKDIQQKILVTNALRGNYEQAMSIFTSKNIMDWRDRNEILEVKFVFEFVAKLTSTLNGAIPTKCPHCKKNLIFRESVVKMLEDLSKSMQPEAKVA